MLSSRQRPIVFAVAAIAVIWLLAVAGYMIAKNAKVTADKVQTYAASVDFSRLSAADRAKAIRKLADMLNALSLEERRRARLDRTAYRWFDAMTEQEKGRFIDATMPTGFKQMLASFEQMPEDRRRVVVDRALRQLKDAQDKMAADGQMPAQTATNQNALSDELRQKMTKIGLQTFYSQSSAQTKAELAPVLEEMQRMMQSGMPFRGGRPQQ
jgi:hypothetical protein